MRKKAERKIREAAAALGNAAYYRIDQVRRGADLIPKVFDKTLLDMARLLAIELEPGDTIGLSAAEVSAMVRSGDVIYTRFRFCGPVLDPALAPETCEVVLTGFEKESWQRFEYLCGAREDKTPAEKLQEIILDYVRENSGPSQ
ncbi:MAG: hypothetical protein JEZ11_00810 [Desulfobacterales bacterium]|nr:hypothetical protein [Desulfobacterales bacterium]